MLLVSKKDQEGIAIEGIMINSYFDKFHFESRLFIRSNSDIRWYISKITKKIPTRGSKFAVMSIPAYTTNNVKIYNVTGYNHHNLPEWLVKKHVKKLKKDAGIYLFSF